MPSVSSSDFLQAAIYALPSYFRLAAQLADAERLRVFQRDVTGALQTVARNQAVTDDAFLAAIFFGGQVITAIDEARGRKLEALSADIDSGYLGKDDALCLIGWMKALWEQGLWSGQHCEYAAKNGKKEMAWPIVQDMGLNENSVQRHYRVTHPEWAREALRHVHEHAHSLTHLTRQAIDHVLSRESALFPEGRDRMAGHAETLRQAPSLIGAVLRGEEISIVRTALNRHHH